MFFYRYSIVVLMLLLVSCGSAENQLPLPTALPATSQQNGISEPTAPAAPTDVVAPAPTADSATIPISPAATIQPTSNPTTQQPEATIVPTISAGSGSSFGPEILFLRGGALWAFGTETKHERTIVEDVVDFAAASDNITIALLRGSGLKTELWTVRRDGSGLTQQTRNDRSEAAPAWAPDSSALVFGSAATDQPYLRDWSSWSNWCKLSEVHLIGLNGGAESSLGAGCDPSFSPDGKRIAYASPPTTEESGLPAFKLNTIRLINRQGQNGWNFAKAEEAEDTAPHSGLLVYAPSWSPDGRQIVYHRFLGYRALVDISLSEVAPSFEGNGQLLNVGAGWLLPARFAPDGQRVAITENNYSDARGFGGYDNWSVSVIKLEGSREVVLPFGSLKVVGQSVDQLPRGQSAVWSPNGLGLAVLLPPVWHPDLPVGEPIEAGERPGEIWAWRPGGPPEQRLVVNVDFASPLAWLP